MIKRIVFLIIFTLISLPTSAEMKVRENGGMIYIENETVAELEELFKQNKYTRFRALENDNYPAIFSKTLPIDFQQIKSLKYRNELFIRILTPIALKINEEIANERKTLLRLERRFNQDKTLNEADLQKLEEFAEKYDYFSRHKENRRIAEQLQNLKIRINIVPPSIFIAAAALESNWGFSRVANIANNLYKEKIWFTNEGLEPLENKDDGYRFKIFDSLTDSMRSFALKFNSDKKYAPAWKARHEMLLRRDTVIGESIAYTLAISSNLPNYAGIMDYTTAFYDFFAIDRGHLKKGLKKNEP